MIQARFNTLDLNWRKRFKNEDTRCERCHYVIEDLEHFLLHCNHYLDIRQQPYSEDKVHIAETLLQKRSDNEQTAERKTYLKRI